MSKTALKTSMVLVAAASLLVVGSADSSAREQGSKTLTAQSGSPGDLVVSQAFGTKVEGGKTYETYASSVGVLKPGVSFSAYTAPALAASTTAQCDSDGALIVQVCGQVLYNSTTSGGLRYVNIYKGVSSGTSNDTTSVRNSLDWRIFQYGACLSGCTGSPKTENYRSKSRPANGTAYSQTTNFGSKYQRVSSNALDIAGINTNLNYSFRARVYNLTVYVRIPYL